ncbi:unnamed protein product [Rhizophagus irregularis]|nr:unnamed protein product [Rhizophagus irregularis]
MKSIEHQIFYFPKANSTYFESLIELECDTSIDPSYFYGLARYCQYIQRIIIINIKSKSNYGIAKLIEIQKNLKYFEWIDRFDDDYFNHYTECPYTEIFLELEKKADTLNHFKLFFWDDDTSIHTFPRKLLPKLYKLKTLVINEFSFVNEDLLKVLIYNDLEILNINYITLEEASKIIENSGGHLKQILLKPVDYYDDYFDFDENSINFIRKVYKYSPSVEYLSLAFLPYDDHLIEFERLLNICKNLKSLLLVIKNSKSNSYGENLLKVLIKAAPINLREIRFFNDFKFSLEALEEFLEKWRGRPAISILTTDYIYESENYKILIDKYKNDGVIKDFRIETIMNVENMDFKI